MNIIEKINDKLCGQESSIISNYDNYEDVLKYIDNEDDLDLLETKLMNRSYRNEVISKFKKYNYKKL